MHAYNWVLTILGLARFFVFCVSVKVKLFGFFNVKVKLCFIVMCLCAFCLERPSPKWPILYRWDVKPYSLTHSLTGKRFDDSGTSWKFLSLKVWEPWVPLFCATMYSLYIYCAQIHGDGMGMMMIRPLKNFLFIRFLSVCPKNKPTFLKLLLYLWKC